MHYTVKVVDSITQVDKKIWEAFFTDPILSYDWLRLIQVTQPVRAHPRHLIALQNDKEVAILPCFLQYEELYTTIEGRLLGRFKSRAQQFGLQTLPALLVYAPMLYKTDIGWASPLDKERIIGELISAMERTARQEGAKIYGFFYLSGLDRILSKSLSAHKFHKSFVVPTTFIDISWDDFEGYTKYIKNNHHHMAGNIKREINKNKKAGIVIERVIDFKPFSEEFAHLFSNTHRRYTGKESPLTPKFFNELSSYCFGTATAYCAFKDGRLRGYSLVFEGKDIWHVFLSGQEYAEEDQDYTYFNVFFYAPIREAIAQGAQRIYFGAANYEAKLRRGCRTEPLYMWLRSTERKMNLWLFMWMRVTELGYRWQYRNYHQNSSDSNSPN